ncbi:helix-turn-helix domain-containing protein [Embleya sp. NPDC008237]|uniref:helix-turn-helix domain-containing protein n=1 Tax=Embleya sp. NPDC008237 TaxID=3363978 RepID=UPI0036E50CA3
MDAELTWSDVGARVATARRLVGLSQEQVAEALNVDRSAVAKIEAGRRQLSSLELVRLAERLERPLAWFVTSPPPAVASRRAQQAEQRSDPVGDLVLEDVSRDVALLVEVKSIRPPHQPGRYSAFGADDVEAVGTIATSVRDCMRVDRSKPLLALSDAAARIGLYAYSLRLGEGAVDGCYAEVGDGIGVAVINGDRDSGHRRFVLAHEIGHHVLGDAFSTDWGGATGEHERAIDALARSILIPPGISRRWSELTLKYEKRSSAIILGAEYRVSWSLLLFRLRELSLITGSDLRVLDSRSPTRADYLEAGVRVEEELVAPEVSTGVLQAAIRAYKKHKISAERAVEIARGAVTVDELPARDEIPLEALRNELA